MSDRRPVEVFSLSFLDVIACGVGVILFVTILIMTQAIMGIDAVTREKVQEALQYESTLVRMEAEMKTWEEDAEKWKDLQEKRRELNAQQDKVKAARDAVTQAQRQNAEAAQLQAELMRLDQQARKLQSVSAVLSRRKPALKATDKIDSLYLAFDGSGRIRVVKRLSPNEFSSPHYDIDNERAMTIMRATKPGVSVEETIQKGGLIAEIVRNLDPNRHYVESYVEPDAFEDFVRVREAMIPYGWDFGFVFMEDTSTLLYSTYGEKTKVQ